MIRSFNELHLSAPMLDAIARAGYTSPTPIQARAIGIALEGKDLIGCAQTGTGKTAAFAIPIIERLCASRPGAGARALVLAPTRELALQIAEHFAMLGAARGLRTVTLIGGEPMGPQLAGLARRPDVIVATPGRLFDHLERRSATLSSVRIVVLDEADHREKMPLLLQLLGEERGQTLVFTRTKHRADRLARAVAAAGHRVTRLHADRTMSQRREALDGFRAGRYRILVATDIAARGIDVPEIAHVVNFDLPHTPEDYIHRIGRTARAEATGQATSLAVPEERDPRRAIGRHLGHP